MKISIITVSYNSSRTIRETIESVLSQSYPDIEYFVIDGNSTDNTVAIIKEIEPKFEGRMRWLSEPDKGLYDAMNKGIELSTGDIIGFLNSDDVYSSSTVISNVVFSFATSDIDAVFGDLHYFKGRSFDNSVRKYSGGNFKPNMFRWG